MSTTYSPSSFILDLIHDHINNHFIILHNHYMLCFIIAVESVSLDIIIIEETPKKKYYHST